MLANNTFVYIFFTKKKKSTGKQTYDRVEKYFMKSEKKKNEIFIYYTAVSTKKSSSRVYYAKKIIIRRRRRNKNKRDYVEKISIGKKTWNSKNEIKKKKKKIMTPYYNIIFV